MSVERQHSKVILICDRCDQDYEPFPRDEFTTMIASARSDGWEIRPDGEGHFVHRCHSCSEPVESGLERARRLLG